MCASRRGEIDAVQDRQKGTDFSRIGGILIRTALAASRPGNVRDAQD